MGLIGNIVGLQDKGKIDVVVDRPYYMSGELVKGKILVEVTSPIQCNGTPQSNPPIFHRVNSWVWLEVVLLASGKEKVEWKENGTTHTGCIVLYCVERVLQPSTYEFAFEYQLPENLPGSFDAKKDSAGIVAKIEYSMSGTVIVDGVFARDLMKKAILVLYTSRVGQLARPSIDTCRRKVTYLCFDRGTCAFKAAADKTLYDTTDTPNVLCLLTGPRN
ncbi:hypothetical protein DYB32_002045 [Aphanomyces invadans]|uniref:Arrestin-like N-terminal domain-containing protein n=1 Tax=Aphanomyces invadans TaxID=157072 RepID=A0A3R6YDJ1_9STRA|nr:hypothetical protein DYB32_002045 [Aphanomyces invadans]